MPLIEEVFSELHWHHCSELGYAHEAETKTILGQMGCAEVADDLDMLLRLIGGYSGTPWLDAMVNGPLDADKIDYVFRDQLWMHVAGRLGDQRRWLAAFLGDQVVSPQGIILLHRASAEAAYRLLAERVYLYDQFYWAPAARLLESLVRYVLCRYLTQKWAADDALLNDLKWNPGPNSEKKVHSLGGGACDPVYDFGVCKGDWAASRLRQLAREGIVSESESIPSTAYFSHITPLDRTIAEVRILARVAQIAAKGTLKPWPHISQVCEVLLSPEAAWLGQPPARHRMARGAWPQCLLARHLFGGPYIVRPPSGNDKLHDVGAWLARQKKLLRNIARQLELEHPEQVVMDITGPLEVLAYPGKRRLSVNGTKQWRAEQFFVPKGLPDAWGRGEARQPLQEVDFTSVFPRAYQLRVLLISPLACQDGASFSQQYVHDRFRRACRDHSICLEEEDVQ